LVVLALPDLKIWLSVIRARSFANFWSTNRIVDLLTELAAVVLVSHKTAVRVFRSVELALAWH
jgi:hypothetical protein